ncbi:MAG: GNAT family N-acetyltransferase [Verrucomicrobiales bacterium]|nr:GNAT family N-acetyltransferase [Verrucomicrobiales bacterium]
MHAPPLPDGFSIGPMAREELTTLIGWASKEGWNPGLADADIAWEFDPEGFIALRQGAEFVGGGSILSYGGEFGFMGLFIVRADHRSHGLGRQLWLHRRDRLRQRLRHGASIGMDGVLAMVPFYQRGGFEFSTLDLRFEGTAEGMASAEVHPLDSWTFEVVERFDQLHVPAPRPEFLRRWIHQSGSHAVGIGGPERLTGYGVARPCETGFKVGPLFAQNAEDARQILGTLLSRVRGQQVQLDVPESNPAGLTLARDFGLRESFRCARLYLGGIPRLPVERIFGVTSFEFG